jgi:hypothetical protein
MLACFTRCDAQRIVVSLLYLAASRKLRSWCPKAGTLTASWYAMDLITLHGRRTGYEYIVDPQNWVISRQRCTWRCAPTHDSRWCDKQAGKEVRRLLPVLKRHGCGRLSKRTTLCRCTVGMYRGWSPLAAQVSPFVKHVDVWHSRHCIASAPVGRLAEHRCRWSQQQG